MASSLPFAVRVTAGAVAAGLDGLRRLPAELPGLSVTLAGRAMRTSMRVRQEITALATRGDELLSPLTDRPEEQPGWARFDDEEEFGAEESHDGDVAGVGVAASVGVAAAGDVAAGGGDENGVMGENGDVTDRDEPAAAAGTDVDSPDGPPEMPGYDALRLAQVRGRMLRLTSPQLAALLAHEEAGRARASFVTMLQNRITTLAGHHGGRGSA